MKNIKINNRYIGKNKPVFIIAEIGSNHNQNIKIGKKLIDISVEAGVDAVKFQSFTVENWISKEFISFPTLDSRKDIFSQLKDYELSYSIYKRLKQYAEKKGIICFSSPSHIDDIDKLNEIGVPAFKFGSVQITDLPTISYAAKKGKPIILSTGASSLAEVKDAVESVYVAGSNDIALLHCIALYPAKMSQLNLRSITFLQDTFNIPIGYSDHSLHPIMAPVAAVSLGACIIEKHITLSRKFKGPDHSFALEPKELKAMVYAIRQTEKSLGSHKKILLQQEKTIARMGRRSLVSRTDIAKGTKISKDMITIKRPGYGIRPADLNKIEGMIAVKNISKDEVLSWKKISHF